MPMIFALGRVLFVLIFIFSGASKLLDVSGTAALIATKFALPPALAGFAAEAQAFTGMQPPQLLAIVIGVLEIVAGLMIAVNFGTRLAAFVLILFTAAATYYVHDFWNQVDPDRTANLVHALKNLAIIGGLFVFFALGSWRPLAEYEEYEQPRHDEVLREEPMQH